MYGNGIYCHVHLYAPYKTVLPGSKLHNRKLQLVLKDGQEGVFVE